MVLLLFTYLMLMTMTWVISFSFWLLVCDSRICVPIVMAREGHGTMVMVAGMVDVLLAMESAVTG